jgi:hypothetical protein
MRQDYRSALTKATSLTAACKDTQTRFKRALDAAFDRTTPIGELAEKIVKTEAGYARRRRPMIEKEMAIQINAIKQLPSESSRLHYIETITKTRKNMLLESHNRMVETYGKVIEALRDVSSSMCHMILGRRREGGEITIESLSKCIPPEISLKIAPELTNLRVITETFKTAVAMDTAFIRALAALQEGK